MSTSPTLPQPPPQATFAHAPLHHENNNSYQHSDTTSSNQQPSSSSSHSPRSPLRPFDSSLTKDFSSISPHATRHDYNSNNNYSTRASYPENRSRSPPYRDNNYNTYDRSLSPHPHPHPHPHERRERRPSYPQERLEYSHGHRYYPHQHENGSRAGSPRQHSYYHTDSAHPSHRSASPRGMSSQEPPAQSAYYNAPSEPCREPCCVDSTRAAPYSSISNSNSSSSYVAYPSVGPQAHHFYPSEQQQSSSRAQCSPDSPRTPAFSPSMPSSSSTSSPSSSATPFTPTTNSPATVHNSKQADVLHDSSRKASSANNKDDGDEQYMEVDQPSTEQPKAISSRTARTASKPFKVPRPANSFMLYRAENGKKYPGLVATELSAKLGEAWRKEPQDVRDRYEELAEQAKREHALKYPDYKFAPVKRGTGKRALKLAAEAIASEMAEMDAATLLISMASMAPAPARVPIAAAAASNSSSNNHDRRMYSPTSPTHPSASVSAMGTRPMAQRPIKVASLNKSNVPISNDSITNVTVFSNTTESITETTTSTAKDVRSEQESLSSDDMNAGAGAGAGTGAGEGASQQQQQQQSSRAYPQLSPPLILFREALARRSPQLASSLVAQIVINVWLGVTEELRERYEIMAESDPRFKDKTGYIKHVPVTSGTPTTASEAMMANQIAQLLRKSAAADHFTLPQSNKRKRAMSRTQGPGAKFARIAPAPISVSVSVSVPTAVVMPNEHSSIHLEMDPVLKHVEPVPTPREASPIVSSTRESPVYVEATLAPASVPTKDVHGTDTPTPTKTTPVSASATDPAPARNDFTPTTVIPMPMPSSNRRQTRANAAFVAMAGYVPSKSASTSSSYSDLSAPEKPPKAKAKKAVPLKVQKVKVEEDQVTPANRPVRRIVRPSKYSS